LGLELVNFLGLRSGSPFDARHTAMKEIGWSRVVWDLLDMTASKLFNRERSGWLRVPRPVGASLDELDGACSPADGVIPQYLLQLEGSATGDGKAVSLLMIETRADNRPS
jgi:hypothetical protein